MASSARSSDDESPDNTDGWAGLGMVRIERPGIAFLSSAR
jgi:hypothetical protein